MQLLIVDDSNIERMILKEMLQSEGYAVQEAENGKQALAMALASCPDMIISDILMPVMDGFKLCREIRADSRTCNIPFVFYTGTYTKAEDEEFAFKMGADRFLIKNTEWADLFRVLKDVITEKEMGETFLPEDSSPENSFIDEKEIYKVYNERLINKLEDKVAELEQEVGWRKKLEKQLYESQESLQLALDGANLGMWDWNVQTGEAKFNQKWVEYFGYRPEDLEPHVSTWENAMHPDDLQKTMVELEANLNGTTAFYESEHRLKDKAGKWRWVLARGKVVSRDGAGKALRHVGTFLDISDRIESKKALEGSHAQMEKQVEIRTAELLKSNQQLESEILQRSKIEAALRESEERFRMLAENARDVIYRMSLPDGIYEYISPAAKEISGYPTSDFYQNPMLIRQILHPDWHAYFDEHWGALLNGKVQPVYELQIIHKSGEIRWLHFRNVIIRDHNEKPIAIEGIGTDVTGIKQAEMTLAKQNEHLDQLVAERTSKLQIVTEALGEEKERYRQLVHKAPIGILHYDVNGVVTECNERFVEINGSPREKLIGANLLESLKTEGLLSSVKKSLAGEESRFEGKSTSVFSGRTFYSRGDFVPIFSEDRQVLGGLCVVEDTTEQLKAKKALQKSEEKYRTILESIEDGYFEVDLAGNLTFFNKAMALILGYPASELKGTNYRLFMDDEFVRKTFQKFNQVFKTGQSGKEFDWKIIRKNGDSRYLDALVAPMMDSEKHTIGFRGVVRDVSDRRLMQQFLSESEKRYRLIFESAPVGIFHYDTKGIILACNQAYVDINGSTFGKLIGFDLLKSVTNPLALNAVQESLAGEQGHYEGEYTSVTGGRKSYIKADFVPVFSKEKILSGGMCVVEDITVRKLAGEELQKSEEKYRNLFQHSNDAIFVHTLDGKIIDVNSAACRLLGYDKEKFLTLKLKALHPEESVPDAEKAIKVLEEKEWVRFESKFVRVDSKIIDVDIGSRIVEPENGIVQGIVRDITKRKLAENALAKSEARYRLILDTAPVGIFHFNKKGIITECNKKYVELSGSSYNALVGFDIINKVKNPGVLQAAKDSLDGRLGHYEGEYTSVTGAKTSILRVDFIPVFSGSNKEVSGGVCVLEEITARVMAEEALRDSEEKYRGLAERSPIIIILIKKGGRPYYVSPSVEDVLGFLPEELIGKLPGAFMSKEDEVRVFSLMDQIINGLDVDSFEIPMGKKDGTPVTIEWTLIPIKKGDELDGFQAIGRDITEKRIAEDALRKSRKQLRELSKHLQTSREQERAAIAREIHDDLGQSLTAIKMDVAWQKSKLSEDRAELHIKAEETLFLVDSAIKTVKRISAELRPGLLDDLGLSAAIEWQVKEYQKRSNINIDVIIEPEEIVLGEDLSIAIFRVCQETLTNVIRHAGATDVRVRLTKKSQIIELEVTDNGCGISDQSIAKKNSFGLLGMRERVHAIGGKISISRIQEGGTKVAVTVPIGAAVN